MTFIDILFAIPLAWFAFKGFTKGFIAELAMLIALLLGIFIAIQFSEKVGNRIGLEGENAALIAFFITFLGVVILVYLVGRWASSLATNLSLGFFNNLLGSVFGILKTAFILSICIYFINHVDKTRIVFTPKIQEQSFFYQPLEKLAPFVFTKLEEHQEEIEEIKGKGKSLFSKEQQDE